MSTEKTDPKQRPRITEFNGFIDREVFVESTHGHKFRGILKGWDKIGNIILTNVTNYPHTATGSDDNSTSRQFETILIRTNHILAMYDTNEHVAE